MIVLCIVLVCTGICACANPTPALVETLQTITATNSPQPTVSPIVPTSTVSPTDTSTPAATPTIIPSATMTPAEFLHVQRTLTQTLPGIPFAEYPEAIERYLNAGGDLDNLNTVLVERGMAGEWTRPGITSVQGAIVLGDLTGEGATDITISLSEPVNSASLRQHAILIYVYRDSAYECVFALVSNDHFGADGFMIHTLQDLNSDQNRCS